MSYDINRNIAEIDEALLVGQEVIRSLDRALASLGSARNYGLWDMLGGGFLSGMLKHSKIKEANEELNHAKLVLDNFRKEVAEVHISSDIDIEVGGFAKFADYFFDGLIADWYVQSKINENRAKVEMVKDQVNTAIGRLMQLKEYELRRR